MTRRRMSFLVMGVLLLVVAATRGLAVRPTPTGPLVWTVALDQFSQSIVVDGQTHRAFITTIPFGVGSARMSVLDTDTGAILRQMAVGGHGRYSPAAVDERAGRVFVAASVQVRSGPGVTGIVRVLDARRGALVRTVTLGLFPQGVAVDEQTSRAFVTSVGVGGAGLLGVLDTRTGRLLRTVDVGMGPQAQVVLDARRERVFVPVFPVYSQTGNGHVSVLDARSGRLLYSIAADTVPVRVAVDTRTGHAFVADESGAGLRVFDTRNGHLVRTILTGRHPGLPVVDEQTERAFVLTTAGISVLDTRSGAVLRSVAVRRYPGPPAVDARSGRVFVATNAGQAASVSVLDARTGAPIRRTVVPGDITGPIVIDERAERVIVLTGRLQAAGSVGVLDARSGALLRMIPVVVGSGGMAVDERTGHVFVLNGPRTVPVPDPWAWLPAWLRRRLPILPPPGRHSRVVWGVSMIDPRR